MATIATVKSIKGNGHKPGVLPLTGYHSRFTPFLIERSAIRNRRKFFLSNTTSNSNRPKKWFFRWAEACNPRSATTSDRNSQELKFNVNHCKQRTTIDANRGHQPDKTQREKTKFLIAIDSGFPPVANHNSPITLFLLIDSHRIRIGPNSHSLSKRAISNRQRKGCFSMSAIN